MAEKQIVMTTEDGSDVAFYVVEETRFLGSNYLLVTEEEDAQEVFLLKEIETQNDEAVYEFVEDDRELEAVSEVFSELLDDTGIEVVE